LKQASLQETNGNGLAGALIVLAAVAAIWFTGLGGRALFNPDEGRYAEIPREMVATGDWVTPRLNDIKYFEKPPLHYWATAIGYEVFGESEFTARLWVGLTGFAGVLLAFVLGRKLYGATAGVSGAVVLASSLLYFVLGHLNILDMGVSFFLQLALAGFLLAQPRPAQPDPSKHWMTLAWIAVALALLSKGLIGPVLPVLALIAYSLLNRDFLPWRRLNVLQGVAVFLLISAPWFVLVSRRNPEFAHFFFIHEHFERYLTPVHKHSEPAWYFPVIALAGALPWTALVVHALASAWGADRGERFGSRRFLLIWIFVVIGFFSLSSSKLAPYILPAFPAMALLTGDFINRAGARVLRAHLLVISIVVTLGALAAWLVPIPESRRIPHELMGGLVFDVRAGLVSLTAAAWLGYALLRAESRRKLAIITTGLGALLFLAFLLRGSDALRETRSGRSIAQAIAPVMDQDTPLFVIEEYDQTVSFYLGRTHTLVDYRGEFEFGLLQEPGKALADRAAFLREWNREPKAIAIMKRSVYEELQRAGLSGRVLGGNMKFIAVAKP
jgi:4-amino-4-deoxy-L-arabinose transferase-like glycosyltransferase